MATFLFYFILILACSQTFFQTLFLFSTLNDDIISSNEKGSALGYYIGFITLKIAIILYILVYSTPIPA